MREIVWLVADSQCSATIQGFFRRPDFERRIGCRRFSFSPNQDMFVHPRKDPGTYGEAHELLRGSLRTHNHAIIVLDNDWSGSPGPQNIEADIVRNVTRNGWRPDQIEVIVIVPELEAWIWQDNPHVEEAFGHTGTPSLRRKLETLTLTRDGYKEITPGLGEPPIWPGGAAKPTDPKAAAKVVSSMYGFTVDSQVFSAIAENVGINNCQDPAFHKLRATLQRWYPSE